MTVKILIGASELAGLIENNPQIEVDLLRSALPQVAEIIRRRAEPVAADLTERVRRAFDEIVRHQVGNYGAPAAARQVIRQFLETECREEARNLLAEHARKNAEGLAKAAVAEALKGFEAKLQTRVERARDEVDSYIKEAVGAEVLALLRGVKVAS